MKNGFGFSFSVSSALFCMQIAQQRSLTFLLGFVAMYISRMMFIIIELCSYTKNLIMFHQLLYIELLVSRLGCCKKTTNIHVQKGRKKSFYWAKNGAPRNKLWALTNNLRHTKMTCMVVGSILNSAGGNGVGCRRV